MTENEVELAWCAGIFDGEGTVGVYTNGHGKYVLRCSVMAADLIMLTTLQDRLGGSVRPVNNKRNKPLYSWALGPRATVEVLQALLPYLVVKASQAMIAMRFYDPDMEHQWLSEELKRLKRGANQ